MLPLTNDEEEFEKKNQNNNKELTFDKG